MNITTLSFRAKWSKLYSTEVACVQIRDTPPLYLYASKKNQVSKIDLRLIKLPFAGEKKEGKEQMTLLYYLLRRILALKSISHRIKYDTIYHDFGYDDATPKRKFDLRKSIKSILDAWKGSLFGDIEFIDYREVRENSTPHEIIIEFKIHKDKGK